MNPASDPDPDPTHDAAIAAQIRTASRGMLRGGLVVALVVAVVAVVVAGVIAGGAGVLAALCGGLLALVICALGPLVMGWTAQTEPMVVMGIAMISFVTKLGALLVLFLVVDGLGLLDTRVFALSLGAVAVAFIAGETVAFARARTPTIAV